MEAVEKDTEQRVDGIHFEKRRYPRLDIHLPIECDQMKSSITHTGNISEGGVLIFLPEQINVSQCLKLKLFFSLDSELNSVKALAEVVWTDNHLSKDWENYPYGVKFFDISPKDRTKLRNFISRLSLPSKDKSQAVDANMLRPSPIHSPFKILPFWLRKRFSSIHKLLKQKRKDQV